MSETWTIDRARELDSKDDLGAARSRFALPEGLIYLDGNSLGALGTGVAESLDRVARAEWGRSLATGWDACGWMEAPERVGGMIARLIGARSGEVIVADTTSIALAKVVGAAVAARPGRKVVLSSTDNFPSDLYAAGAMARHMGAELRVVDRSELPRALDGDVAACCLTHVDFRTGEMHDIAEITSLAHGAGALMIWDLCHSVGAVPVGCEENGIDLAVGCTYKYLNGGPGSPSFIYVRTALLEELENPLPGWLGHSSPFSFDLGWEPTTGIRRFITSSPSIVALAALEAALGAFEGVEIGAVREKSVALGQLFIEVIDELGPASLSVASPRDPDRRGSQVSLRHQAAAEIVKGAAERGVVGDFRAPDLCRFGFTPLYLSYEEVFSAARIVSQVAASVSA